MAKVFQVDTGATLTANLISYYKFEDGNDFFGANNLTNTGAAVTFSAGKVGNCAVFSAALSSELKKSSFSSTANTVLSFAGWFKSTDTAHSEFMRLQTAATGAGTEIDWESGVTGKVEVVNYNGAGTTPRAVSASAYNDGNWHFLVLTNNGGDLSLYIDNGSAITTTGSPNPSIGDLLSFGSNGASGAYFTGSLNQWGIWSKILSSTERTDLWNAGNGQTMVNLFTSTLSESSTLTATLAKLPQKLFAEASTLTDTLAKLASRIHSEATTLTDTLKKLTSRALSEVPTISDVFAGVRIKILTLTERLFASNGSYALSFDGSTNYGGITGVTVSGTNCTVEALLQNVGLGSSSHYVLRILGANTRTYLSVPSANHLTFSKGNPQVAIFSSASLSANSWHVVVLQWRNNAGQMQARLIVDNVDMNGGSWVNFSDTSNGTAINIFNFDGAGSQKASGSIGRLRFWNRIVSDADLTDSYNGVRVPDAPDGEWLLNEGAGTTIYDSSPNAKNGTITSPTWIAGPNLFPGIAKFTSRALADTSTILDSIPRSIQRALADATTLLDTLRKTPSKVLSDSLTTLDTIRRTIGHVITESATLVQAFAKQTARSLTDSATITDFYSRALTYIRSFTESLSVTDVLKKLLNGLLSQFSKKYPTHTSTFSEKYPKKENNFTKKYP